MLGAFPDGAPQDITWEFFTLYMSHVSPLQRKSNPITGLDRPRAFQELRNPDYKKIGI